MRLLLVGGDERYRDALGAVLEGERAVGEVARAGTPQQARAELRRRPLDLVVLREPCTGRELVLQMRNDFPAVRWIVLADEPTPEKARQALSEGADGFLGRDRFLEQGLGAFRAVLRGQKYLDPALLHGLVEPLRRPPDPESLFQVEITPAEHHILVQLGRHLSNAEIASERGTSVQTVKTQLKAIFRKLKVRSRGEALGAARRQGLV